MDSKKMSIIMVVVLIFTSHIYAGAESYQGYNTANIRLDGVEINGDVPAIIMNGRTLVPIRMISERMGMDVKWNPDLRIVDINSQAANPELALDRGVNFHMERAFYYSDMVKVLQDLLITDSSVVALGSSLIAYSGQASSGDEYIAQGFDSLIDSHTETIGINFRVLVEETNSLNHGVEKLEELAGETGNSASRERKYNDQLVGIVRNYTNSYLEYIGSVQDILDAYELGRSPDWIDHDQRQVKLNDHVEEALDIYQDVFDGQLDSRRKAREFNGSLVSGSQ